MSDTVNTNQRIEKLEQTVAVVVSEVAGIKSDIGAFGSKLDLIIQNRPGFKDAWAPIGLAVTLITIIAGLAAGGPLARLSNIEQVQADRGKVVAAQAADLAASRAERQEQERRLSRLEAIIDARNQARFNAVLPVAKDDQ